MKGIAFRDHDLFPEKSAKELVAEATKLPVKARANGMGSTGNRE